MVLGVLFVANCTVKYFCIVYKSGKPYSLKSTRLHAPMTCVEN